MKKLAFTWERNVGVRTANKEMFDRYVYIWSMCEIIYVKTRAWVGYNFSSLVLFYEVLFDHI